MSQTAANRGFHPILAAPTQRLFIDTCMQAWPDADYANAHRHGVDAMAVTAWMPHATVDQALEGIMYWHLITRTNPSLEIAYRAHDIPLAKAAGKATFVLTAQDGDFIGNKLHRVEAFYRLGLRIMLPAYNSASLLCDGCLDRADAGLTRFGMMVVAEANRVGLLLDGTHVGRRSSLEMIDASEDPVIFSHSNPRARAENPRNIDDEQILACARRGGVIGLVPWGPLVFTEEQTTWPTLHQFLDIVDYTADLIGNTEHIGIGTDMSLGTYPTHAHDPWGEPTSLRTVMQRYEEHVTADLTSPKQGIDGFSSYPEIENVAQGLSKRGYSEASIEAILGANFLRVFDQVWK